LIEFDQVVPFNAASVSACQFNQLNRATTEAFFIDRPQSSKRRGKVVRKHLNPKIEKKLSSPNRRSSGATRVKRLATDRDLNDFRFFSKHPSQVPTFENRESSDRVYDIVLVLAQRLRFRHQQR